MLNVRSETLFLGLCSFVLIFSFQIISNNLLFNRKYEYLNGNVLYKNKKCFHLKWKNTSIPLSELRTYECKRFLTIAKSKGRTGNNLFQIATILGLAYKYDLIPIIPLSFPLHKFFNLPNIVNFTKERLSDNIILPATKLAVYMNFSKRLSSDFRNFTMEGSFQSWRYFNAEKDIVRNALRLKSVHVDNAQRYMEKWNPAGHRQICIHIRRGDFLKPRRLKKGSSVVDEKFVEKAKHILQKNTSNVVFFVATNDKQWCRENLKNVNISPFENPGDDLALMSLSDDVVVSAGTFGWWGAWLSGGNVVYYRGFPRSKSHMATYFNKDDYYPPDWIGIK